MYICILGRQPALSMAELEAVFGANNTRWFSDISAHIDADALDIEHLGGIQKAGVIVSEIAKGGWVHAGQFITKHYLSKWQHNEGKITLGISAYGFRESPRDIQKTGIVLKSKLKSHGVSLRLIPNSDNALNTAVSHHNKLGLAPNKVELLVVRANSGKIIVAESTGAQNISSIAARDQERPMRDAFVGMLPPKLALLMTNLAIGNSPALPSDRTVRILDPFCGTGVILQEAALLGHSVYGTDLSEKMVRYSRDNISWLLQSRHIETDCHLAVGDATDFVWQQPIDTVVCESYLGQPFSAPPSPTKLEEVRGNCNHIISRFLQNIHGQLRPGTTLCVAVPAWRDASGRVTHLPLIRQLGSLGYAQISLQTISSEQLLYYRENQVVARELLILTRQ